LTDLRPQSVKDSVFHTESPNCKTPKNLTVDGCSVQAVGFEFLNGPHSLLLFP